MTATQTPASRTASLPTLGHAVSNTNEHESEVRSYCRNFDATFVSGTGSTMVDSYGREFIDFLAGCSALNYGHNDPSMVDAVVDYLRSSGITHGLDMRTKAKTEFVDTFVELVLKPRGLDYRLQFTGPTGTNAIEAAMKLARKATGRSEIIAFTNGFHGVTAGALAATGNRHHRMGASVPLTGVTRAFYDGYLGDGVNTATLLDKLLSDPSSGFDAPAAILLETVQGEGGLNTASVGWLEQISDIAKRYGALLIVDDIQAGCGRTGAFFSFELAGLYPDIVVLSKSLSGFGLPMALVLMKPEHDVWTPGEHNGTFRGNNVAFVTATVALRKYWSDDQLAQDVTRKGWLTIEALGRMTRYIPGATVKGRGMMVGLDVADGSLAARICQRCFEKGLIIETSGAHDQVVKILAPITIPDELLLEGLAILERVVATESKTELAA